MKIAITSEGTKISDKMDSRFGRAQYFIIWDVDADESGDKAESIKNEKNLNAMQGAGIQSAQAVARLGVKAVITGHCGPKAFKTLQAAGVKIYSGLTNVTVAQAVKAFRDGQINESSGADVEGHWV